MQPAALIPIEVLTRQPLELTVHPEVLLGFYTDGVFEEFVGLGGIGFIISAGDARHRGLQHQTP